MCDFERVTPRSRGKPKRFLWPNKAGPPGEMQNAEWPPGTLWGLTNPAGRSAKPVGTDIIRPRKGRALALQVAGPSWREPAEHIPRLNDPPDLAEIPRKAFPQRGKPHSGVWLFRAGPPGAVMRRNVPPEPEEHIPRLNGPPNRGTEARRFLRLGRAGPPGKEGALSGA